jgi:voltage-gated potassium channel
MPEAERPAPDAKITTFGDALWWACTTVTTVGYGDLFPVTATGRSIAVRLMLGGIALIGTVTASVAAWLVQKVAEEAGAEQSATRLQVNELTAQVRAPQDLLIEQGRTDRQSHLVDAAMLDEPPSVSTNGHAHLPPQFDPGQDLERRGVG